MENFDNMKTNILEAPEDENLSALLLLAGKIPKYLVVSESVNLVE